MYALVTAVLSLVLTLTLSQGYTSAGERLGMVNAIEKEIEGSFDLILHGGNSSDDLLIFAILDIRGDDVDIEPFTSEFNYRRFKKLTASKAVERAKSFVRQDIDTYGIAIRKIVDSSGRIYGYEIVPLYRPFVYAESDVLDNNYVRERKKIKVYIRLKTTVEKLLEQKDRQWNR